MITIERLIEMYMMYLAMSSHIKISARVTALWLSVSVDDLVRKLDIDLLDFCKALSSLWVLDSMYLLQSFSLACEHEKSNRSCNERSIHHAVILLKSAKFHDTGPCISARPFFFFIGVASPSTASSSADFLLADIGPHVNTVTCLH